MTYKTVQSSVLTVLRKLTADYDTDNTAVDDYRIIVKGKRKFVVLRRGEAEREILTLGTPSNILNTWTILLELYIPFDTEPQVQPDNVIIEAQRIIDEFGKWPKLDASAGVINAEIQTLGEPEEWGVGSEKSLWWRQVLELTAQEIVAVTLSE